MDREVIIKENELLDFVLNGINKSREVRVAKDGSHEYLMERWIDARLVTAFRLLTWKFGYRKTFWKKEYMYYDLEGYKYWVIEDCLNREKL